MYKEAAEYIKGKITIKPELGLILGSGLGSLAETISSPVIIDYEDIPGFPKTTVPGHAGRFVVGDYKGKSVIAMQGRFHYYEGNDMETIVLPVRVMKLLGVEILIVTNAAGGINPNFRPADLMVITDHINFSGVNPLRGPNLDDIGPRFPDMTEAYSRELIQILVKVGKEQGIDLKQGVYAMMPGPSFETPAEIRMLRTLGADAVGMSTVPEVIAACHAGIKVVGISCISNMAAGILDQPLSHEEVIETADKAKSKFIQLLDAFIPAL